jgi:hypothetical protein
LGAPDQDAVKGHVEPLGSYVMEINLTGMTIGKWSLDYAFCLVA